MRMSPLAGSSGAGFHGRGTFGDERLGARAFGGSSVCCVDGAHGAARPADREDAVARRLRHRARKPSPRSLWRPNGRHRRGQLRPSPRSTRQPARARTTRGSATPLSAGARSPSLSTPSQTKSRSKRDILMLPDEGTFSCCVDIGGCKACQSRRLTLGSAPLGRRHSSVG